MLWAASGLLAPHCTPSTLLYAILQNPVVLDDGHAVAIVTIEDWKIFTCFYPSTRFPPTSSYSKGATHDFVATSRGFFVCVGFNVVPCSCQRIGNLRTSSYSDSSLGWPISALLAKHVHKTSQAT